MRGAGNDPFAGGGDVGRDLAAVDWSATPLGPPEQWPQSLRTVVQLLLGSRFAMWMAWGPELTFFCNDAYRRDTLGSKYPWALGRPSSQVWAEIWDDIAPRIESVLRTGEATWDEALLLFLERSGFREESYHTFSYSPLDGDDGVVAGMLCVVSEDTERVIGARRMSTLRDLGAHVTALQDEDQVLQQAARQLAANPWSLPFTATYLFDDTEGRLVGCSGVTPGAPAAPEVLGLAGEQVWPLEQVLGGATALVEDLASRFSALPTGAWDEPPERALLVPFRQQDGQRPLGVLVAGLNRYRPYDDDYRDFVELVAGQVGAALTSARAHREERERVERLVELDRAKTTFFTNVSHEFRTPLTLLLGPAADALDDLQHPLPPAQRERVEVVARNGERLLKLVNTLLDVSRLDSGRLVGQFVPVDLPAYTAELAGAFSGALERVGLTLTTDCPPLPAPVLVDREMWAKIVLNLLSNALKFTFAGGVTVTLRAAGDRVELAVTDTGTGIPVEQQAALFERFSRVEGARSRTHEGTGIGLALVHDLAAAHGGSVGVDSAPGRGSTFTVSVPLGDAHLPPSQLAAPGLDDRDVDASASAFVAEASRWLADGEHVDRVQAAPEGAPVVLVVDDNADMREYVAALLAREYRVLTAADGLEGLAVAREQVPDLVLSDVMMPRLDGFGLLQRMRADAVTATVPVVLLSARSGDDATVEGLDAGADDYLVKPFSARELMARVRANLELERVRRVRRHLERDQALLDQAQRLAKVGSWELDVATGVITASPEYVRQVQLSAQELQEGGLERAFERVHPDDLERVRREVARGSDGSPVDVEFRLVGPDGGVVVVRALAELSRDADGRARYLRGSLQDVTEQRATQLALAAAAADREAAAREHAIADELQRSLLPATSYDPEALSVATYYRAGVEGTQVGGDWYDVIALGAGRTALVLGDVMGRGVQAAAVMGQLRSAVRAYARLDLPPADVLEFLDGAVRELGEDSIVTCVYAVYDPYDRRLTYANAGHLPPLLKPPDGPVVRLTGSAGAPLGTGVAPLLEESVELPAGSLLALYTDGLVEHRDRDLDAGIDSLAGLVDGLTAIGPGTPAELVEALLPDGPDDDVAVLLAQVEQEAEAPLSATHAVADDVRAVRDVRRFVTSTLDRWGLAGSLQDDVELLVSELATNAVLHGRAPVEVRLRRSRAHLVLEVLDAGTFLPRRMRPSEDDEHGRGLQLVALLTERWGTRPTGHGKSVWCVFAVDARA